MTAGDERWDDCPEGVICGMVDKIRWRRRKRQLGSATAACGLLLCLVVGYAITERTIGPKADRALTCVEVVQLFDAYHADQLNESKKLKVEEHFGHCPGCKRKYDQKYGVEARRGSLDNGRRAIALRNPSP